MAVPNYKKMSDSFKAVDGNLITVNNVKEGYKLLPDGKVDALAYDIVPLEYIFNTASETSF